MEPPEVPEQEPVTPAETPIKPMKKSSYLFKKQLKPQEELTVARAEATRVATRLAEEELQLKKNKDRRDEELHEVTMKKIKLECALLEDKLKKCESELLYG